MDRLLQRHARRWGGAASPGENAGGDGVSSSEAGAHLDADEMNAYAENALPAAARSRYASHLADCDSCRRVVTDLALAAQEVAPGERGRAEHESASPSKSWWGVIAAFFAPPVLRYAVPALLLLGVIVVALVATRDRNEPQFVAQRSEERQAGDVAPNQSEPTPSPAQGAQPNDSQAVANTSATTEKTVEDKSVTPPSLDGTLQANANADRTTSAPVSQTQPAPTDLPSKVEEQKRDREQNDALAGSGPETADVAQRDEVARERKENLNDQLYKDDPNKVETTSAPPPPAASRPASPSAGEDTKSRDESTVASESAPRQSGASQAGARTASRRAAKSTARDADDSGRADNSAETRSVAGRQFRRQGDAWVDTAYSSSRSTISLARGSDKYRAVVSDEPAIRNIAEQLGGVVIVVWKGKAYRIH
ncbi:MAG: hypothetical protein WCF57_03135 [Pyrinomonadaceae bacterium]